MMTKINSWVLLIVKLGKRVFHKTNRVVQYLSVASLHMYIFHMVFLILISSWLSHYFEAHMNFLITVVLCFVGLVISFEMVKRFSWFRFLFGSK